MLPSLVVEATSRVGTYQVLAYWNQAQTVTVHVVCLGKGFRGKGAHVLFARYNCRGFRLVPGHHSFTSMMLPEPLCQLDSSWWT